MKLKASTYALAAAATLMAWGCKKDLVTYLDTRSTDGMANVKLVHAAAYTTNYSVAFKLNDLRVSNNITYSTPFPGGGLNTGGSSSPWYLSMKPGNNVITLSVPKVGTSIDSIPLISSQIRVEANKYYSAYLADTAANAKVVLVNDNLTPPDAGTSRFKFVNLIPNVPALDLYWGTRLVATNIAYTSVSPEFPLTRGDTARWYARTAGSAATSAPVAFYPVTGSSSAPFTVPNQRVMTVFARGYSGGTGNRVPAVSLLYNY